MAISRSGSLTKPLAWVTGANGLIGNYLVQIAPQFTAQWRLRGLTRADFDLLDFASLEREFRNDKPRLVIHCAAVTSVAGAQRDQNLARRLNVELTRRLAMLAAGCRFVFFSTDLVFDGQRGNYIETDSPNPLHLYGETKTLAEQIVLAHPEHLVVRTSINGGVSRAGNRGFNEQMRTALRTGQGVTLFTDEFRNPIPALETARAVWELAEKGCHGIYHIAGAEKLSRWEIGQRLIPRWPEVRARVEARSARDFTGPPRALDTSLDISKAQTVLAKPLPGLTEWLAAHPDEPF